MIHYRGLFDWTRVAELEMMGTKELKQVQKEFVGSFYVVILKKIFLRLVWYLYMFG